MRNFFRVAAVILIAATGVYLYELTGGEVMPAKQTVQAAVKAVAVSKSPPARIKSRRTIDRSRTMPRRPAGLERTIEARGGSDFPIMMPEQLVRDEATAKRHNLRLRMTDDGYTSVLTLAKYDVVIYGTSRAFRKQEALRAEQKAAQTDANAASDPSDEIRKSPATRHLPPIRRDYAMAFEEADDGRGGSLSFGRYGVDYHIEFYCHDDAEGCIDTAEADAFLTAMFADREEKKAEEPRFRINIGIGGSTTHPSDPSTGGENTNPDIAREGQGQ